MYIVYTCYGGAHSSPVAAAVHLQRLPRHRTPAPAELMSLSLFDRTESSGHGILRHVGVDGAGNRVYVLGRGRGSQSVLHALKSGFLLAGGIEEELLLVDTLGAVNVWMRIGGFLSRALGWVWLGRPIVIFGTRRAYPHLVRLVEQVEARLTEATTVSRSNCSPR